MSDGLLLVGWDGADWDHLDGLLAAGRLPVLASLLARGLRAPLRSTIPPVTPAAWTAMATGWNPARTGVLQFRRPDPTSLDGYAPEIVDSSELRGTTLFELAAADGAGVALVGWPMTWPPFPLPGGVLLSGFPRPRADRAPVWPPEAAEGLERWDDGDPRPRHGRASLGATIAAAAWWDRRHAEFACRLLRERRDRVTAVVFSGSDHLSHPLWGDPRLDEHYERLDGHLGELLEAAGDRDVLLVSDHGFTDAPTRRVHLNRLLEGAGLLALREARAGSRVGVALGRARRAAPKELWKRLRGVLPPDLKRWVVGRSSGAHRIDPAGTRAYRVPLYEQYEGVHAALRGRTEGATAEPTEREAILREAEAALRGAVDDRGRPLVRALWRREALFEGPFLERVPDLLVELEPGWTGGGGIGEGPIEDGVPEDELAEAPGKHRREGIFLATSPGGPSVLARPVDAVDVGPIALHLAGLAVPDDCDGRVPPELQAGPVRFRGPRERRPALPPERGRGRDRRDIERSLRALGYLE